MAQLAIKGHPTRGKEVIEILEMFGGKNIYACNAVEETNFYFIVVGEIDYDEEIYITDKYTVFTLEEFLEKFPYKVGDKVVCENIKREVTKMVWEEHTNTVAYKLDDKLYCNVIKELQPYKEETMEETKKNLDWHPTDYLEFVDNDEWADEVELNLGNSYEIQVRDGQTFAIKKKPQYPKTYEECCEITNSKLDIHYFYTRKDKEDYPEDVKIMNIVDDLRRLIICRNAYWKIAGEQMGLGKPWEPDWLNIEQDKFVIYTHNNVIHLNCFLLGHNVLAFPTFEIRAMFYENFKELIEKCKELL